MLVRKTQKGSEWKPSENPGLQVGETIEITNPQELIMQGLVVAVGEDGQDLDAFDLYGVVDKNLVEELKAFKEAQHQQQVKKNLEKEREELEKELADLKKSNSKKYKAAELEAMSWQELRQKAIDAKVFNPKMKQKEVIAVLTALLDD